MKLDVNIPKAIDRTTDESAALEVAGFDGLWIGETQHDPFLMALRAVEATERVTVGTGVAIAFARTPMTLAYSGWDLAEYSQGRFILGLGSQVRPHIERRFSMPWSRPAARMRELISALRAIWHSWRDESKLDFRGDFYTHTLMTPFFRPERHDWGPPEVMLAGVGELMTEVAGEVAEGFLFHAFTTPEYLMQVTVPALIRGRAAGGRDGLGEFQIMGPAFTCSGRNETDLAAAIRATKAQIAFYASTPAYRPVLDCHGWGDLQPELTRLSKEGRWQEMGDAIDDTMLGTFAVVGDPVTVGRGLKERWSGIVSRVTLYTPYASDHETLKMVAAAAKS
jgi:probable F420-dependent oxidoreductase